MTALLVAAALVAPAPRLAYPTVPDLSWVHEYYKSPWDDGRKYDKGVIVEAVKVGKRVGTFRYTRESGPYWLNVGPECDDLEGKTVRMWVVPIMISEPRLVLRCEVLPPK